MSKPVVDVGVNASQKGVLIWQFIREFFRDSPIELEFTLHSTTEQMVQALKSGEIDVAWHGPMGYVQTIRATDGRCQGIGMRDGDVDYHTFLVAPPGSEIKELGDLAGRRIAFGYEDVVDNWIIPVYHLRQSEIPLESMTVVRPLAARQREQDYSGESAGVQAVRDGRADAAFIGYKYWDQTHSKGHDGGPPLEIVWTSPPRGHCVFATLDTVDPELASRFTERLFQMDYNDPAQRQIMNLEWLKAWVPAKMAGAYDELLAATA